VKFALQSCRFCLQAHRAIYFPAGVAGNVLRGGLGSILRRLECADDCPGRTGMNIRNCERRATCTYARIFEPTPSVAGPSGLADWPRPFVIRGTALTTSGGPIKPGDAFCFGLNLFDTRNPALPHFTRAIEQWAEERQANMLEVEQSPITIDLDADRAPVSRIRIDFQTPTELKAGAELENTNFSVLLARARDRLSTLRSLYGPGPLEIDFRAFAERARSVTTIRSELQPVALERRSSRTGQRHGIGGFLGFVEYEGNLTEFLPYLEAAHWTGVGRHCTWGNGQIDTEVLG